MNPKLSVIIPCYNEEKRFIDGFDHYYSFLKKASYPWELIFVNDGSKDKTLKFMRAKSKSKPNVQIVSYEINRGKGYAIIQGVSQSKGEVILFTDIDHSVPIKTIDSFFKYFKNDYSVVVGSRRVKDAKLLVRQPKMREFLGRCFTFLVNILIYWGISDSTCGFKAFEREAARKIFPKITIYDWAFDAEIIFLCKKYKINFTEAPVVWRDVRGSRVRLQKDILKSLFGLFKIRINDLLGRY